MYRAPKTIVSHPGVESCDDTKASGIDEAYRHDVWLKDGWTFTNGRTAGCRGLHCRTVADFLHADPQETK